MGKRIAFEIEEAEHVTFKKICVTEGLHMKDVLSDFVREYVQNYETKKKKGGEPKKK